MWAAESIADVLRHHVSPRVDNISSARQTCKLWSHLFFHQSRILCPDDYFERRYFVNENGDMVKKLVLERRDVAWSALAHVSHVKIRDFSLRNRRLLEYLAPVLDAAPSGVNPTLKCSMRLSGHGWSEDTISRPLAVICGAIRNGNLRVTKLHLVNSSLSLAEISILAQACVKGNRVLKSLSLEANNIGSVGLIALCEEGLVGNSTLTHLNLAENKIGDRGMEALCSWLVQDAESHALVKLDLSFNYFTNRGCAALKRCLFKSPVNRVRSVCLNGIDDPRLSFGLAVAAIATSTMIAPNISELTLSACQLNADMLGLLSVSLQHNLSLRSLDLSHNVFLTSGGEHLARVLQSNTSLTCLNLSHSNFNAGAVTALSQALSRNNTLKDLDLSGNTLGERGIVALSTALTLNYEIALQKVSMAYCHLTDSCMEVLSTALAFNTSITDLNLACNQIMDNGANYLAGGLLRNTTMRKLNLQHNQLSEIIKDVFKVLSATCNVEMAPSSSGSDAAAVGATFGTSVSKRSHRREFTLLV
jgi:Ran GTPase-activating protein (RanGAP) involved in mRNA processing and transport